MPVRPAAVLLAALALLAAGCAGGGTEAEAEEPSTAQTASTSLRAVFDVTGTDREEKTFTFECDPPGGDVENIDAVCQRIATDPVTLTPQVTEPRCALPAGIATLHLSGTLAGEEIDLALAPCSAFEDRAVAEWASLLGFEVAPTER